MAVQVRVQDLQSIADATVTIDGLTVVTGANNSGKTSFMRAIRGVFTNAPAGPLVRHGCAHLTVTLTFDDGTEIIWEKGWEKPGQKGKTVNRYTINGMQIAGVGRGVPPEVESLGVREITAGSDRVWPQIAQQFDGTLFLVNRPGSAIAEALSDVERVGKLSSALKASEKDRRAANAELKVRRKDVETHKQSVQRFDGLDVVLGQVRDLSATKDALDDQDTRIKEASGLLARLEDAQQEQTRLSGFVSAVVPDGAKAEKLKQALLKVGLYQSRWNAAHENVVQLKGFTTVSLPDADTARSKATAVLEVKAFQKRYAEALGNCEVEDRLVRQRTQELAEAEAGVKRLLGDRGECPTCNTIHEGTHP